MTAILRPYSVYRPSGLPWLGHVPAHWGVRRLKHVCSGSALYGANVAATQYQAEGIRFLRTTDIAEDGRLLGEGVFLPAELAEGYVLSDGDVLLSRSGTVGRSFLYAAARHGPCAYAGYLVRFVPSAAILPKYLFFFTKAEAFNAFLRVMAISSTIENVNGEKYANMPTPLPPLPEQRAIVRYLDYVDGRVRRYVGAKRKLIALLEEEKQAIVNRAVTRGLDPNVRLKPSGVEWLGDVPEHWEIRRAKTLGRIRYGLGQPPRESAEGLPLIRATNVERGSIVEKHLIRVDPSDVPIGRDAFLRTQEIIVVRSGAYTADSAIVPIAYEGAVTGYDMVMSITSALPMYMAFALLSSYLRDDQLIVASTRSAQPHLNAEELGAALVLVPSLSEQAAIVEYLDKATADIDAAITRARRQIELVEEYRTRLIADVVTGKLDVREAAAQLEDEADHQGPAEEGSPTADSLVEETYDAKEEPAIAGEVRI